MTTAAQRRAYRKAWRIRDRINKSGLIVTRIEYYSNHERCIIHTQNVHTGKRGEENYDLREENHEPV